MMIAVTGGIGSGKSTVAKILVTAVGGEYIDTDQVCRRLMERGGAGYQQFTERYGTAFLDSQGSIDRHKLRQAVFSNSSVKNDIENILHPLVRTHLKTIKEKKHGPGNRYIIEVPLLFEVGWQDDFDMSVLVYVPEDISCGRVVKRDQTSVESVRQIIASQISIEEKCKRADWVINNATTYVATVCQAAYVARNIIGGYKTT